MLLTWLYRRRTHPPPFRLPLALLGKERQPVAHVQQKFSCCTHNLSKALLQLQWGHGPPRNVQN